MSGMMKECVELANIGVICMGVLFSVKIALTNANAVNIVERLRND